jgi:hypothetical protein
MRKVMLLGKKMCGVSFFFFSLSRLLILLTCSRFSFFFLLLMSTRKCQLTKRSLNVEGEEKNILFFRPCTVG